MLTRTGPIEQVEAPERYRDTTVHREAVKPTAVQHRAVMPLEAEHLLQDTAERAAVLPEHLPIEVPEAERTAVLTEVDQEVLRAKAAIAQVVQVEVVVVVTVRRAAHREVREAIEVQEVPRVLLEEDLQVVAPEAAGDANKNLLQFC